MLKSNGKALLRLTTGGVVQSINHKVKLSLAKGEYYTQAETVDGQVVMHRIVTARGFERVSSIAGVRFVKPDRVKNDQGIEVDNPIITREEGAVTNVRIREILVGRSPNGNQRALDLTLSYDVQAYLASQMFNLLAQSPDAVMLVNRQAAERLLAEKATRGAVPVGSGNYLVYNLSNINVIKILQEHSAWAMLADRTAATLVERNLLRRHFGFSETDEDGCVEFTSWVEEDIEWDDILMTDDKLVLGEDAIELEQAEDSVDKPDVTGEPEAPAVRQATGPAEIIAAEIDRIGDIKRCRRATASICKKYSMKFDDYATIQDDRALLDIYMALRDTN